MTLKHRTDGETATGGCNWVGVAGAEMTCKGCF